MVDSPCASGRVEVRRKAACRRRADQQPSVLRTGDRDRAAGQVEQDRRAGECGLGARRHRHPHVLTDLRVEHEAREVGGTEQQVGTERHPSSPDDDRLTVAVVAGCEVPALVELAVGRQVGLGGDAQHPPAVDHDGGVEQPASVSQRCPDHEYRAELRRRGHQLTDRRLDLVQQGLLHHQVVDRVAGQRELREERHRDTFGVTGTGLREHRSRVPTRVGNRRRDRAGGDPYEALGVHGAEVHASSLPKKRRPCVGDHRHSTPFDLRV